ncbi:CHAT domain-containing protein [Frankia sp. CiP3]|uniref:CHAT domain-containing protein n=1 Tax=Frankia sp. CiP3 TaxID=2880971 RepID=UPI001EF51C0A|nr:CHAT domain-containing protein [Frankia sp. CiP3]
MGVDDYLNFDLLVRPKDKESLFHAEVTQSPVGTGANIAFHQPVTDAELEAFQKVVVRPSTPNAQERKADEQKVKELGRRLFDAMFTGVILRCYERSIDAALNENYGLRIRLRMTQCPELAALPWEYLCSPNGSFLALSETTSVVRFMDVMKPSKLPQPLHMLHMLVMLASPTGASRPIDISREWSVLHSLGRKNTIRVDRVEAGTISALQQQLHDGPYHILHYGGHGELDELDGDGFLLLEDADGGERELGASSLAINLHDHRSLLLVVLNSCVGAHGGRPEPWLGVARKLVQHGVPAVVAMQSTVSDEASFAFVAALYKAIVDEQPLEVAMARARISIWNLPNVTEWGTPVLYLQSPMGRLIGIPAQRHDGGVAVDDRPSADAVSSVGSGPESRAAAAGIWGSPAKLPTTPTTDLYQDPNFTEALAAKADREWPRAILLFEMLQAQYPTEMLLAETLATVRNNQLATWNEAAEKAEADERWADAVVILQKMVERDSQYADRLGDAEVLRNIDALYLEIQRLHQGRRWDDVVSFDIRLAGLGNLATTKAVISARSLVASAKAYRDRMIRDNRYKQALEYHRREEWEEAAVAFDGMDPAYRPEAARLAQQARTKMSARSPSRSTIPEESHSPGQTNPFAELRVPRGGHLHSDVTVSLKGAIGGTETVVRLPAATTCIPCGGSGLSPNGASPSQRKARTAEVVEHVVERGRCSACGGIGWADRTESIHIPAGVYDGQTICVSGRGFPGLYKIIQPGDLLLTVRIDVGPLFQRAGIDLFMTVPVTPDEARFGALLTLPSPDQEPLTLPIPQGTASGWKARYCYRGVPTKKGDRGQLIATVRIVT